MNDQDYINKWLEGSLSDEEKKIFESTDEYQSLKKILDSVMSFRAPEYAVQAELERLQVRKSLPGRVVSMNWFSPLLRVAAILIVIVGSYFYFVGHPSSPTRVETAAAEKTEVALPDSSLVTLNAVSKLVFYEQNWTKERKVTLEGEAFFKVTKGSRFDVETSSGTIRVLGTKFNVKNRRDYFEVICYEGLVEVISAQEVVTLPPKHMFRVVKGLITKENDLNEITPGWTTQESSFQSVPFSEVIAEFERQYAVTVTTHNINPDQLFTGRFVHSNISLALKSISFPLNLSYQIMKDKNVVLSGEIK
jgi:ferric-dicitrate binding protein FerR (iron transport regulator)